MKAMLIEGDQLVWSVVPEPQPAEGEVLIEICATALNRADLLQRQGSYPSPPGWPEWMGLEVAGRILSAPAGSRWQEGDRVCALLGGGGYAERVAVPQELVMSVPDGLSMAEAAALPEAFATSYLNLCIEGGMQAGDHVFIAAGASGLGMAAIQLAKHLGATVATTVSSPEKAEFVRQLGADVIVDRKQEDVATALARQPINVAMDCVAGGGLGPCLQAMAPGGRYIVIATLGGAEASIDMKHFFMRGLRLIGSTLRSRSNEMKGQVLAALEKSLWPAISDGSIKVLVHDVLPMADAEKAHQILFDQANMGKVVLELGS